MLAIIGLFLLVMAALGLLGRLMPGPRARRRAQEARRPRSSGRAALPPAKVCSRCGRHRIGGACGCDEA